MGFNNIVETFSGERANRLDTPLANLYTDVKNSAYTELNGIN